MRDCKRFARKEGKDNRMMEENLMFADRKHKVNRIKCWRWTSTTQTLLWHSTFVKIAKKCATENEERNNFSSCFLLFVQNASRGLLPLNRRWMKAISVHVNSQLQTQLLLWILLCYLACGKSSRSGFSILSENFKLVSVGSQFPFAVHMTVWIIHHETTERNVCDVIIKTFSIPRSPAGDKQQKTF